MPRAARGRTTRSTRSPATFDLDGHLIETYNHIDDLPNLSSLPKKRPRHATRGATAAERRADRQAAASSEPIPNGIVTRSSRQNLLRSSNSASPLTAPSPSSEDPDYEHPPLSCRVCLKSNTPTKIICCSICRKGIHTFCLNPPVMDLPNDASWKCVKCRRAHIPLKKEARIILRDALNTYSSLCTHSYVNAVANVVCVVSDSESDHNKNRNTSVKPTPQPEPSQSRNGNTPNDNTVILRVSTDDSDLDSDVDDDIQPNPAVNRDKPQPTPLPEPSHSNHHPAPHNDDSSCPQPSFPSGKDLPKKESTPSSSSSLDIDDERPLSELMSRSAHRRHRQLKGMKSKDVDHARASPKMRLKAKQKRTREENPDSISPAQSHPTSPRDLRNLPPKRRGRKPASKEMDNDTCDTVKQTDGEPKDDTNGQKGREAEPVGNNDQNTARSITPTTEPNRNEVKRESNEEVVEDPNRPANHAENTAAKDTNADVPNASGSNVEEGYPADTEDDLPLSKRTARYRNMTPPGGSKEGRDSDIQEEGGEPESGENPSDDQIQLPNEDKPVQKPKVEAVVQETTGNIGGPVERTAPPLSQHKPMRDEPNPSASQQNLGPNVATERNSSREWSQMTLDPKREALFALARVQRQRPKPGDSSGRLVTSLEGETAGRFKLESRTKNVPESERQRIQVTALAAASNMRRNVSNMASTMAGLRPHSPRISKGSINLLLQQNQTEVRGGIAPQRSFPELEIPEVTAHVHETHRDRDRLPTNGSRLHTSEQDGVKFSPRLYPLPASTRRQDGSGVRQYANPAPGGGSEMYPMRQHQSIPRSGMLSSLEPEAQPFAKHSRGADPLPHAKRQRTNKSDLHNMLSNDNMVSVDESRNTQRGDPTGKPFPEADRQVLEQPTARHSTLPGHASSRPIQSDQAMPSYSYQHRLPETRFGTSGVSADVQGSGVQGSGTPGLDRLSQPQGSVRPMDDRNLRSRASSGYTYQGFQYGSSLTPGEAGGHRSRDVDDRHMDQRPQGSSSTLRGHGPDFRNESQLYSSTKPSGESFSPSLRWNEERNLGDGARRRDYEGANTANQSWPEARPENRSGPQETSYEGPVNQFVPIDRRTRRPMPYVPTATRKAQFEQGRALAFFDSRPGPSNAEPTDVYRVEDGTSMGQRTYSARQEGPYSSHNDYAYPAGGRSRTSYPSLDSQAPTTSFRGDYYSQRRSYAGGSSEQHIVDDRSHFLPDSLRDAVPRERVGGGVTTAGGSLFGQPRSTLHRPGHDSSGAPLEPPIEGHKPLSIERVEPLSLGPLMDTRMRMHQEKDIPRMANLESDRMLQEKSTRLTMGPRQDDRYGTSRLGSSSRRSQEFADPAYGSYLSGMNQSESIRPPVGSLMDTRIPAPLHADPSQYRSRDALPGQATRSFAPNIIGTSDHRGAFDRPDHQVSNSYSYARRDAEGRSSIIPPRVTRLEERNEELRADQVSNIPLVARFNNSITGYVEGNAPPRSSEGGSNAGDRSMGRRTEQREQLPSLRSNPSLRDLLS